jgi:hypothetical protein
MQKSGYAASQLVRGGVVAGEVGGGGGGTYARLAGVVGGEVGGGGGSVVVVVVVEVVVVVVVNWTSAVVDGSSGARVVGLAFGGWPLHEVSTVIAKTTAKTIATVGPLRARPDNSASRIPASLPRT